MKITNHGKQLGTDELPLGQDATVVVLVREWKSLGISSPLFGLRYSGKTLAKSENPAELRTWFVRESMGIGIVR